MATLPLSGATRVACVIGDPIRHSLSPTIHNAAFRHLGLDAVYVAFDVKPGDLRRAVAGFRALQIMGINVTVPHKERILPLLDSVSAGARSTGAVNTVVNRNGKLHGENTDVIGFTRSIEEAGISLAKARVLMLGAGGASRAVLTALAQGGARSVVIANRTPRRSAALVEAFGNRRLSCSSHSLDKLDQSGEIGEFDLVVNSTSVGLLGELSIPLPFAHFKRSCLFYDLIPRSHTDFIQKAKEAHRHTLDGLGMLLHQGAAAFELWTGQEAPLSVMRASLNRAIRSMLRH